MTQGQDLGASNNNHHPSGDGFGTAISLRLPQALGVALDAWIASQPEPRPSRPEAILRVLAQALAGVGAGSIPVDDLNASNDE
jgi:hypothetical protein